MFRTRSCLALSALILAAAVSGCGPRMAEVRGTVRYDGKALASGTIQFLGVDGIPHSASIGPDGSFRALVPQGNAKVIVSCMNEVRLQQVATALVGARGQVVAPEVPQENLSLIPARYADWTTSGLSVRVAGRSVQQDFSLTVD